MDLPSQISHYKDRLQARRKRNGRRLSLRTRNSSFEAMLDEDSRRADSSRVSAEQRRRFLALTLGLIPAPPFAILFLQDLSNGGGNQGNRAAGMSRPARRRIRLVARPSVPVSKAICWSATPAKKFLSPSANSSNLGRPVGSPGRL